MHALYCRVTVRTLVALPLVATLVLVGAMPRADADDRGLAEARERAQAAAAELSAAQARLGALDQEITDLAARVEDTQARLEGLRQTVRETIVQQFINADLAQVQVPDVDVNVQARAEALSSIVTQGNQDAVDEYLALAEDLAVARDELVERRRDQESAVVQLREKRAALDAELRRLEELERRRQEEMRRQEQERRRLAAEEARRQSARETSERPDSRRRAASAPVPARAPSPSGSFVCPVRGPHAFIDSWGAPRSGGRRHQGVDMMAARGVPTVAPVSGRVEHRSNRLGGLSWHLFGDDGNYYFGTHLSEYANVGAGWVAAGTVIGYVGDTGNARGNPHLHFEIHPGGRGNPINPYPTVRAHC